MKQLLKNIFDNGMSRSVNPLWMITLRCGVSLIALLLFAALQPDFDSLFSNDAFIPPDIANGMRDFTIPSIYSIYQSQLSFFHLSYDAVLLTIRILYPVVLLSLFLGLFTRLSAIMALVLQLIILNSIEYYSYGVDVFIEIATFYCCIFPVGNLLSLDRLWFKRNLSLNDTSRYLKLFRIHVCIIYFTSGFEKLIGHNWRNGESIWRMIHGYNSTEWVNVDFLYKTPVFLMVGWGTIILEIAYPIFINIAQTRKYWLSAVIIFHVGIAFFMGLYFFSSMMIILNLTAYYMPYLETEKTAVDNNIRYLIPENNKRIIISREKRLKNFLRSSPRLSPFRSK